MGESTRLKSSVSPKRPPCACRFDLDGEGRSDISTGVPFFDHMLTLVAVHGFFDITLQAQGDLEVDSHHTVEDVGIVLGDAVASAIGDRKGIRRYGYAVTPMDEALATVALDLSRRPYLVFQVPACDTAETSFNRILAKEFFKSRCQPWRHEPAPHRALR